MESALELFNQEEESNLEKESGNHTPKLHVKRKVAAPKLHVHLECIVAHGIVSTHKAVEMVGEPGDLRDCQIPRALAAVLFAALRKLQTRV